MKRYRQFSPLCLLAFGGAMGGLSPQPTGWPGERPDQQNPPAGRARGGPRQPGKAGPDAQIAVRQIRKAFPFGAAIGRAFLNNARFQEFFKDHFNYAVFENETKWYANERAQGQERYADADAMFAWCQANGIPVRGHCVFWEPEKWQPRWLQPLTGDVYGGRWNDGSKASCPISGASSSVGTSTMRRFTAISSRPAWANRSGLGCSGERTSWTRTPSCLSTSSVSSRSTRISLRCRRTSTSRTFAG